MMGFSLASLILLFSDIVSRTYGSGVYALILIIGITDLYQRTRSIMQRY